MCTEHREPGGIDPSAGVAGLDLRRALERLGPDDRAQLIRKERRRAEVEVAARGP
jgi:hypothetical protein